MSKDVAHAPNPGFRSGQQGPQICVAMKPIGDHADHTGAALRFSVDLASISG
jgi:hypothetical protein